MSAKYGLTRVRVVGLCIVAAFALSALFAGAAQAKMKPITATQLSLGDSLAFGYSQQLFNENLLAGDPASAFEHGYVNDYYEHTMGHKETALVNNGCPGETSDSMIGNGALAGALGVPGEAPCAYHYLGGLPLHHEYGAGQSQLENAIEVLTVSALGGQAVKTVTLNIGPNDELHAVNACKAEVQSEFEKEGKSKYGGTPEEAVTHCIVAHVPGLIKHLVTNIALSAYVIRNYGVFAAAASGKPELAGLKFTGKLIFVEAYNPYGNVTGSGELLTGSNGLAAIINGDVAKALTDEGKEAAEEGREPFHACVANMLTRFNPGDKHEPARLQKWTNMTNTSESNGQKNGPDIHATPMGYKQMAKLMLSTCP